MTVNFSIGRRVPNKWYQRIVRKAGGLISFQENIWIIISQSLNMAKKKATAADLTFIKTKTVEREDLNYSLEWIRIIIKGTPKEEEEEYNDSMNIYRALGQIFKKKEVPKNPAFSKMFNSKLYTPKQLEDSYKAGHGSVKDRTIADKLLEMGIMTIVEWKKDFDERDDVAKIDF